MDEKIREIAKTLKHIAIIPDGNRRWAKENGLTPSEGHKKGFVDVAPGLIQESWRFGIHTLTLWCCSTRNIEERDPEELKYLFFCFNTLIEKILPLAIKNKVRIVLLGRKDRIPKYLLDTTQYAEQETEQYKHHVLNLAIDYSGKDDIVNAYKILIKQGIAENDITRKKIALAINTTQQPYPNPDFVIRTGNECRMSGFMSWQISPSELYFIKKYFPDFDVQDLKEAILEFGSRERRLGK